MKHIGLKSTIIALTAGCLCACSDFEEVNIDPNAANRETVLVQALFNSSVYDAQLSDWSRDIIFHRTWGWGSRFLYSPGFTAGPQTFADSNNYMSDYWRELAQWIYDATQAVLIGEERIKEDLASLDPATNNYVQMARIWRAHLFAEAADMFGPYPINGFQGEVVPYNSVEEVYEFVDSELKDAVSKLDPGTSIDNSYDAFYDGDMNQWKKYGNSLRLRYAMRFSNVGEVGKNRFIDAWAAAGKSINNLIGSTADIASVKQAPISTTRPAGSVFNLDYIDMSLTATITNLTFGIGGIDLTDIAKNSGTSAYGLPAEALGNAKDPMEYMGEYRGENSGNSETENKERCLPIKTNTETAGYLYDCLPKKIDPRTLAIYHIPGHKYLNFYYDLIDALPYKYDFTSTNSKGLNYDFNAQYTFCSFTPGGSGYVTLSNIFRNDEYGYTPAINNNWRFDKRRVFFGDWETYFLLAEAREYGWITEETTKHWYEEGVKSSFAYHGLSEFANDYLSSTKPNRIGTTASFDYHNTDASIEMERNVYQGLGKGTKKETFTYHYPTYAKEISATHSNDDALSKIMTQKYIAQMPWQPLEATNDYRRTGLPFIENPYYSTSLTYMTSFYNENNYNESTVKFMYSRVRYPASLKTKNAEGYKKALELLGGDDLPQTPLAWQLAKTAK